MLLLAFSAIPFTAFGQEANLILNAALETTGSAGAPAHWSKTFWGSPTPTFQYPTAGRSGNGAAITYGANSNGDARWSHAPVSVVAGATYTYSNWYKSTVPTEIDVVYTNSNGSLTYGWIQDIPSSANTWKQATASIVIPAGVTKATVFHLIDKKGTLTVDDFSLTKVGTSTPPPPPPPGGGDPNSFSEGMVTITFDDSWLSQYQNGLPILESAGFKGTMYITTEPIQGNWDGFINLTQLKDMKARGHELAGHTVTHADLTTLNTNAANRELKNSKSYIQNQTGATVTSLAYPYGSFNTAVINLTKAAGYTNARGVEEGLVKKTDNKFTLKSHSIGPATSLATVKSYIDQAKANKQWYILTLHEILQNGDEYSTTPAQLQEIVTYLKSSGIKVTTMAEATALMAQ